MTEPGETVSPWYARTHPTRLELSETFTARTSASTRVDKLLRELNMMRAERDIYLLRLKERRDVTQGKAKDSARLFSDAEEAAEQLLAQKHGFTHAHELRRFLGDLRLSDIETWRANQT